MRRYRVLFVCIGNACRSQMAEAFAREHGGDALAAQSAGTHPCEMVAPATEKLMRERGIDLAGAVPKGLDATGCNGFDLIVNMSGRPFPRRTNCPVREWPVEDPIWLSEDRHREVRDQIEALVKRLVEEFRGRQAVRGRS